jgi:DNA-3-methyladenine glycosylase
MLNIVTGEIDEAAAVLIRGVEQINGPGRVAADLRIDGSLNGRKGNKADGSVWFEDVGCSPARSRIRRTPRIGIDYAGPIWAAKKLRFVLQ